MASRTSRHNPATVSDRPEAFRRIYSHAVEVSAGTRLLFISGQIGATREGTLRTGFSEQCEQAMENVEALLAAARMTKADAAKITYFLTRAEDLPALGEARRRRWASAEPPAVTTIVVAALASPEYLVEIEVAAAAS
jgi:2-iminobutanoate/2-iminopropanoate deaminase